MLGTYIPTVEREILNMIFHGYKVIIYTYKILLDSPRCIKFYICKNNIYKVYLCINDTSRFIIFVIFDFLCNSICYFDHLYIELYTSKKKLIL